jgi:HD-GYP domain-containing protein (c-di-GMP phosphodiesterase class II)
MTDPGSVRLADVMAALSIATDLSMGQPVEHAMRTCIVAMRLGDALKFDDAELHDVYYESLLRYIGCNADTAWAASVFGDEIALRTAMAEVDAGDQRAVFAAVGKVLHQFHGSASAHEMEQVMARVMSEAPSIGTSFFPGHCDVARALASRLGFPAHFVDTIGQLYARWDGHGVPALAGDAISRAFLCTSLAQDAVVFHRIGGVDASVAMARQRRGGAHAPDMVDAFVANASKIFAGLDQEPAWDTVLRLEPGTARVLDEQELDNAFEVMADYGDIKSPWFLNHSQRVAELAGRAARACGMSASTERMLRRAALVHDIGKVGISSGIWGKEGTLTDAELALVRRHPYETGRIFGRSETLGSVGALAALHHETLDGRGYHRGLSGDMLSPAARLLIAANAYQSRVDKRAHREALSPDAACAALMREVECGRIDGDAVRAVVAVASSSHVSAPAASPLSEREREVLTLLARGNATKQIAAELQIAYKTADRHIQNVYAKIGVNTRAAATLYAMRHRLV